jgi:TonB family protein
MEATFDLIGRHQRRLTARGLTAFAAIALSCLSPLAARAQGDAGAEPVYERGVVPPLLVARVSPIYPEQARHDSVSGVVLVRARVGRDGRVREAAIVNSIPALDEQALIAARRFQFTTPRRDGLDCEAWVVLPIRFGEFLPHGGRLQELEPAGADSTASSAFWAAADSIQKGPAGRPGPEDAVRRADLMVASLALDVIPQPGDDALTSYARGDTCGWKGTPESRKQARDLWADAAQQAPWWPAPYLRLSAALIADRDYAGAERCARIVLASRPNDAEANALIRRATQGRLGEASVNLKKK